MNLLVSPIRPLRAYAVSDNGPGHVLHFVQHLKLLLGGHRPQNGHHGIVHDFNAVRVEVNGFAMEGVLHADIIAEAV